jgi:hypothetical protein
MPAQLTAGSGGGALEPQPLLQRTIETAIRAAITPRILTSIEHLLICMSVPSGLRDHQN